MAGAVLFAATGLELAGPASDFAAEFEFEFGAAFEGPSDAFEQAIIAIEMTATVTRADSVFIINNRFARSGRALSAQT
jgi:hypothetical protein